LRADLDALDDGSGGLLFRLLGPDLTREKDDDGGGGE
jgi:hypothetical protein